MDVSELRMWIIATIPTLVGILATVITKSSIRTICNKFTGEVKDSVKLEAIVNELQEIKEERKSEKAMMDAILQENVELKKQMNRILTECSGVKYDERNNQKV